jgi:hypothetical protein
MLPEFSGTPIGKELQASLAVGPSDSLDEKVRVSVYRRC